MLVLALIVTLSLCLAVSLRFWGFQSERVGQASLSTTVSSSLLSLCFCLFMILPLLLTLSFTSLMVGKIKAQQL